MLITTQNLNELENRLTDEGIGLKLFTPEVLTYNNLMTAVNNGLLPTLKLGLYLPSGDATATYEILMYNGPEPNLNYSAVFGSRTVASRVFEASSTTAIMQEVNYSDS